MTTALSLVRRSLEPDGMWKLELKWHPNFLMWMDRWPRINRGLHLLFNCSNYFLTHRGPSDVFWGTGKNNSGLGVRRSHVIITPLAPHQLQLLYCPLAHSAPAHGLLSPFNMAAMFLPQSSCTPTVSSAWNTLAPVSCSQRAHPDHPN